jgi:hypothetical protein
MKKFLIFLSGFLCILSLSGCFSGFSRLPEVDFVGKSREEVVKIFASNPQKAWGTHINICIADPKLPHLGCNANVYFKTAEEGLTDERVRQSPALRGYFTTRFLSTPAARDFYEVVFDKNDKVISQETSYIQDAM